eukprot:Skav219845  [mRNA]  locus=scaffold859:507832:508680:- [translate_table: standard]
MSKEGLGPAHRLTLVLGSEILLGSQALEELDGEEGQELCLHLVRNATTEFTKYTPREGEENDSLAKCVLLGPACVGKTALIARYCNQTFDETYVPTDQLQFRTFDITTKWQRAHYIRMHFLDVPGHERWRSLSSHFMRKAAMVMAVFSLKSRASLQQALSMVRAAKKNLMPDDSGRMSLVGTHADSDQQEVSEEEAIIAAEKLNCSYHAVSNATGEGVSEALQNWLDHYLDQEHQWNLDHQRDLNLMNWHEEFRRSHQQRDHQELSRTLDPEKSMSMNNDHL